MIPADHDLDALFKRLHLANARRVWRDLVQRAERETWSYRDFLTLLVAEEIAHRQQTRLTRLTRRAHFPFLKTIDDFQFTYQSTVRLNVLGSALSPDFVTDGRSLIFGGKPGRGKTHLAVAIAYRAIQNGFDAFFTTAATLIDDLSAAFRAGELAQALPTYTHPAVLVVDEVGYLTYGTDAANMLFHVVNERHRRKRAMIFTTNKALKAWGGVLHAEDLAQAIIDRVLERGRLFRLDGPSLRTLHVNLDDALNQGSDRPEEVIRISGNQCPEFPEPTPAVFQTNKCLHPLPCDNEPVASIADPESVDEDGTILITVNATTSTYTVAYGTTTRPFAIKSPATPVTPSGGVVISSLVPNPAGDDARLETVTLQNKSSAAVSLVGWTPHDRSGATWNLAGSLAPGATRTFRRNGQAMSLNNAGDEIALMDAMDVERDRFAYVAAAQGVAVVTGH